MKLDYFILTYADSVYDMAYPLGVIAHNGKRAYLKALGLSQHGDISVEPFAIISEYPNTSPDIYKIWISTLKEVTAGTVNDREKFHRAMKHIGSSPIGFSLDGNNQLETDSGLPLEKEVDRIFDEITNDPIILDEKREAYKTSGH